MTTIICEHKLPIPTDKLEEDDELLFSLVEWDELEFHSFNYGDSTIVEMIESRKITISDDGQIYEHLLKEKYSEEDGLLKLELIEDGIEKQDYTGEIIFGTLFKGKKHDYWIDFKALFWKGDMKEVELSSYEKNSNELRLETKKKIMAAVEEMSKPPKKGNLFIRCLGWALYAFVFPFYFIFSRIYIFLAKLESWVRRLRL